VEAVLIMMVEVAVFIVFMLEVNAGMGLVYGFAMYLMTWSVCRLYVTSMVDEYK
jgi:hypothetical protein